MTLIPRQGDSDPPIFDPLFVTPCWTHDLWTTRLGVNETTNPAPVPNRSRIA